MFEPWAADLDPAAVESALMRGAVGDYADEAAVLLLLNFGHWLPLLQSAGLISIVADVDGAGPWAQIAWPDVEKPLEAGRICGDSAALRVLWAAASIADGRPVDLGDVAAGLDRRGLALVLAAVAHAAGSHDHQDNAPDVDVDVDNDAGPSVVCRRCSAGRSPTEDSAPSGSRRGGAGDGVRRCPQRHRCRSDQPGSVSGRRVLALFLPARWQPA